MKKKYQLLSFHMNCNYDYLWQHAQIVAMLVKNDPRVKDYKGYVKQCDIEGINYCNEDCYNNFLIDTNRPLLIEKSLFA